MDAYKEHLTRRGRGRIYEVDHVVIWFAIADLEDNYIWALFVEPDFEGKGIGRKLHELMLDWYFSNGKENVWLSASPNTRAESFYKKIGWTEKDVPFFVDHLEDSH